MLIMGINIAQGQDKIQLAQILTNHGEVLFTFYPETPNHKASFIRLAESNYWDTLTFNRVISNFVAQGGCPDTEEGFGDSPYLLEPEFDPAVRHVYGAVGAGRDDNPGKLSAGCQFYIVQRKEGLAYLDDNYTIFGMVVKGMEVIDKIVNLQTDDKDQPLEDVTLDVNIITLTPAEMRAAGIPIPGN